MFLPYYRQMGKKTHVKKILVKQEKLWVWEQVFPNSVLTIPYSYIPQPTALLPPLDTGGYTGGEGSASIYIWVVFFPSATKT